MAFSCASGTGCSVTSAHRSLSPCSRRVTAAATRVLLATPVMAAMRDAIVRAITKPAVGVATITVAMQLAVKAAGGDRGEGRGEGRGGDRPRRGDVRHEHRRDGARRFEGPAGNQGAAGQQGLGAIKGLRAINDRL